MTKPADVLVISAHPDDAEFGVGGTVAKWTEEGKRVVYVVCTSGEKGTDERNISPLQLAAVRREEQRAAAQVLGVAQVIFLHYVDQEVEDTPTFRKDIVRVIRQFRPSLVATSDPYRRYLWHRDHRIVGQVVMDAVYPYARDHLAYPDLVEEGLEPHKVSEVLFWGAEDINYLSDITLTFPRKIAALQCHQTQVGHHPHPNMQKWVEERCRAMAEGSDYLLAEAFHRVELPD